MILSEERIRFLLGEALERVDAPEGCGIVLEGSIAEGFGNESSDVDFLVLEPRDLFHPTMPSILFIDGARVEVRQRSAAEARRQAEEVRMVAAAGPQQLAGIDQWQLDRCQRLVRGFVLENPELVESARLFARDEVSGIIQEYFREVARRSARYALAVASLGDGAEAVPAARAALLQAVKSWVAGRDEAYMEYKWVGHQLDRAPGGAAVKERFADLDSRPVEPAGAAPYVRECLEFVGELGVDDCEPDPARLSLARDREVTTWRLGSRLHVVRHRQDVLALSPRAAQAWRSLLFDVPLPEALERLDAASGELRPLVAELYRVGLLGLRWRRRIEVPARSSYSPPPATTRPVVSLDGAAEVTSAEPNVRLVPLPADRFAAAGMALVWANIMIENALEDATGALGREQWRVFETAARRMLGHACRSVLTAHGVVPLPAPEEAPLRLAVIRGLPRRLIDLALDLHRDLGASSTERAEEVLAQLDELVRIIRDETGTSLFPASFVSAEDWRQTLEIGYDWVRLGAYLDSSFPVDEARDLLAGGGPQPRFRSASLTAAAA